MNFLKWLSGDDSANDPGKGFEKKMADEAKQKKAQQEAVGRIVFETYFPDRDPEGLEMVSENEIDTHPEMTDSEKRALQLYIEKVRSGEVD
jgi:hypothetical protein